LRPMLYEAWVFYLMPDTRYQITNKRKRLTLYLIRVILALKFVL